LVLCTLSIVAVPSLHMPGKAYTNIRLVDVNGSNVIKDIFDLKVFLMLTIPGALHTL
jgi:hypothetical protein